tara:strand:+ start:14618 stop:17407 length:2790 start_codon:yes stop_codon:yes gene_type:complete
MALIDLQTNLKSIKFGRDQRGGGSSNQPYIKRDIPGDGETFRQQLDGDLPVRSGPDFLLRNGFLAPVDAARDVSRLTQMFFDLKSPRGPLFVAKQNLLSRTAVKTEATELGIIGYGGGAVNAGIYNPLSTIAQAGVGFAGMHLNLLGVNPASPLSPDASLAEQVSQGGLVRYQDVVKRNNLLEFNSAPKELTRQRNILNPLFNMTLGSNLMDAPPMFIVEEYKEEIGGFSNRLVKTWFDKQEQKTNDNLLFEYGGGPGSILGIGKTRINFADQRTGINNEQFLTNPGYFGGTISPSRLGLRSKSAGLYKLTSGPSAGSFSTNLVGATLLAADGALNGFPILSPEDQEQLQIDSDQDSQIIYNKNIATQNTFRNQKLVDKNFFPEEDYKVFLRQTPVYNYSKIFSEGATKISSTGSFNGLPVLSAEDQEQLQIDSDSETIFTKNILTQSTLRNQKLVDLNFFPEEDYKVFIRQSPEYRQNKIFSDLGATSRYNEATTVDLQLDSYGQSSFRNEGSGDLKLWNPSVYSDSNLTTRPDLRGYQVGNQRESNQFIDFGGNISGSILANTINDGGFGVVPYIKGASSLYSVLSTGGYGATNNFNRIDYVDNVRVDTYNFSVYTSNGNGSPSFKPTILQRANGSITMTQDQLIAQVPLSQGGVIQDFRVPLIEADNITTSTVISTAPDYTTKRKESRVNLGDPGSKAGKNIFNYSTGNTILDKINGSSLYEASIAEHDGEFNDLAKLSIGIIKNDSSSEAVFMNFRAFIDSFNDAYTAKWDEVNYVGRGDSFYNYKGFGREISMGWTVYAQSKAELIPMYKKLNYLASSLAPDYSSGGFMRGSLARLTVGGYLYNQLGIIKSLTYDIPNESTWEIGIDHEGKYDNTTKELPHMIKITGFSFTPIQEFLPQKLQSLTAQKERYIALNNGRNNNYDS